MTFRAETRTATSSTHMTAASQRFNNTYYLYGTAYNNQSGFTFSNRFVVYSSPDLVTWTFHGDITTSWIRSRGCTSARTSRSTANTRKYVLWYNWYPRGANWNGRFGVATADQPWGPFTVQNPNVAFPQGYQRGGLRDSFGYGWQRLVCLRMAQWRRRATLTADYLSIGSAYSLIGSGEGFSGLQTRRRLLLPVGQPLLLLRWRIERRRGRGRRWRRPLHRRSATSSAPNVHSQPLGTWRWRRTTGPSLLLCWRSLASTPDD